MNPTQLCPQCQAALPANAPEGLCPQCLLKAAAGSPSVGDIIDIGDPAEVAKCFPQFEILELLGRGGMGVVYKARQVQLDRIVALKILPPVDALSPDFVARFTREARSLARLTHANIVAIYDFGESGGLYYFSMEFVDGVNLRALLAGGKVAPAQALAIVPLVCDALAYAHEEGIVHRDIKPENILLDKKGRVKIADFGLAKLLRREPLELTLTLTGVTLGTVRYMAPEQMDKPETVDHRADIYSLGVVIYEMLTGDVPMGRFAPPSQKSGVDVRLDEIILHALEREPAQRYQQVSEMKTDVENVTARPAPAMQVTPTIAPAVSTRRWHVGTIVLCALIVMLSFMPWGNAGHAGFKEQYMSFGRWEVGIEPLEKDVSAWDSGLGLKPVGNVSGHWYAQIPNWILPMVALAVLALAVARGMERNPQRYWTPALSAFGAAYVFLVISAMVFHGFHGVAMLGVFFLFIVLLFKSLIELILSHPRAEDASPGAAAWLLISGLVGLVPLPWAGWFFKSGDIAGALTSLVIIIGVPVSLIIIAGALRMLACPASRFARTCGALAMLPCYAGVVIGLPAGLHAMRPRNRSTSAPPAAAATQLPLHPRFLLPRFSRFAIIGAVWAVFGVVAIISGMFFIALSHVWDGTASPTALIYERPPLAFTIFMAALLAIGAGAPIGTPIYGAIAIRHIRRSGGKIVGLPLAVADVLIFPLLLLGSAAFGLMHLVQIAVWTRVHTGYVYESGHLVNIIAPPPASYPGLSFMVLDALAALAVCFFAARAAWRAISGTGPARASAGSGVRTGSGTAVFDPRKKVQAPADTLLLVAGISMLTALGIGGWLWANSVLHPEDNFHPGRGQQGVMIIAMSMTLAIHAVFIGAAGLLMRRLRARFFVLVCVVLAGLFLPAVLALNCIMEAKNIPQWPIFITTWLGMPVCVWAALLLFREDVREAFAKASAAAPSLEAPPG